MFKLLTTLTLCLGLAACAGNPLTPASGAGQGFVGGDLTTAAAVANSPNVPAVAAAANAVDPTGYACWGTLLPAVTALEAGKQVGLATIVEVARVAIIEVRSKGPCAGLAQPLLAQLALLPGASNAIAIAASSVQ